MTRYWCMGTDKWMITLDDDLVRRSRSGHAYTDHSGRAPATGIAPCPFCEETRRIYNKRLMESKPVTRVAKPIKLPKREVIPDVVGMMVMDAFSEASEKSGEPVYAASGEA